MVDLKRPLQSFVFVFLESFSVIAERQFEPRLVEVPLAYSSNCKPSAGTTLNVA